MPKDSFILALDQGTTSSRSVIFDHSSNVVGIAQKEFAQIYPKPGWVEQDPIEIWSSQSSTIAEVLAKTGVQSSQIAAVGITNQRETTVAWDKETGIPVYNAIVWQDRRTADFCQTLKQRGLEPQINEKTGLKLDPYFSGTKLSWILKNVPQAMDLANRGNLLFGTVDSWLLWQLTDGRTHATDASNASRTLLYNLKTGNWDDELLELFEIPRQILPEIRSCSATYGQVANNHFPVGAPITGIAGDQHAALFGQACFEPGMVKNTYGTGCFLLMNTGENPNFSKNNLLTTLAWKIGDKTTYALEGSVFIAGAAIKWLRDELQLIRDVDELNKLAESVQDANGMFLVPAFAGLGAPHWDPYARGAAFGMTRGTNRAHFCRAVIESIAFQSAELIRSMEKDSGLKLQELRVDGGASNSAPLMQFQSDLLQTKVIRAKCVETTALGAAYLAGLSVGFWSDQSSIRKAWSVERSFEPQRNATDMAVYGKKWNEAVRRSMNWECHS